jgi:K+-transporting ATPase KdpF subunit
VSIMAWIGLTLALSLAVYLLIAMLLPERFQ